MTINDRLDRQTTLHVAILVFPGVEVLDFAGPFEVFSVAARVTQRDTGRLPFKVSIVGASGAPVAARHGLGIVPHHSFADVPEVDLLIVPGGLMEQPLGDAATLDWVARSHRQAALTASVCTGAFVLAQLGILKGLSVTTHWSDIDDLRRGYPDLDVQDCATFVDQGAIVTSAGISAGIGMSLHLVQRILGAAAAVSTARQMEYDWEPTLVPNQA